MEKETRITEVIPTKGNVRHLFKAESSEAAGDMMVFALVDYNLAGYGMTAGAGR